MATTNPYQRPRATVADSDEPEYQTVRIFGVSGRVGRVRYIAYTVGLSLLILAAAGVVAAVLDRALGGNGVVGISLIIAAYGAVLLAYVFLTIQRCHDFDVNGWLSIVFILIPLGMFALWIIPGTRGANRWGPPTAPNSTLAVVGALILPFIFVAGIVAAIAIPAYQNYAKRAPAAEQQR